MAVGSMLTKLLQFAIRNSVKIDTFIGYHWLQKIIFYFSIWKQNPSPAILILGLFVFRKHLSLLYVKNVILLVYKPSFSYQMINWE